MTKNNGSPFGFASFHLNADQLMKATDEEKEMQIQMKPSTSFFRDGMKRLLRNKVATFCAIVVIVVTLMAIIIPMVWPYSYKVMLATKDSTAAYLQPFQYSQSELDAKAAGEGVFPHIFGTDSQGRDYFVRVMMGTRVSLAVGFFASIIVLIIGMLYGSIAGYCGGKIDLIMMRIVDIIYSLPDVLIIILLSVVLNVTLDLEGTVFESLGSNMLSMFIIFALLYWVGMARLIRGQVLTLRKMEYVLAAQSIGASRFSIIKRHILPNCISLIIISTALQIPNAIFTESFLSFLGLGVNAPMPSLGSLASAALSGIYSHTYLLILPAIIIFLIVLSLNLLGDGLRDAFDPRLRS